MWLPVVFVIFIACEVSGLSISGGGEVRLGASAYVACHTDWLDGYATLITPQQIPHKATSRAGIRGEIDHVKEEDFGTWTCTARGVSATVQLVRKD